MQETGTNKLSKELAEKLRLETPLAKHCLDLAIANIVKMDRKQKDYGPDALLRHGRKGVLVRMDDKTARLGNLLELEEVAKNTPSLLEASDDVPRFESRLDSWLDASNYGLIGAALETGVDLKNEPSQNGAASVRAENEGNPSRSISGIQSRDFTRGGSLPSERK